MFATSTTKNLKTPSKPASATLPSPSSSTAHYFSHFAIQKQIGSAKFCVYLIRNSTDNKQYALKAYPFTEEGMDDRYKRESRFTKFSHPHVCKIFGSLPEKIAVHHNDSKKFSFLFLEYAPYGDFYELFKSHRVMLSEKLARTYFHQLIEGLEYLHKQNVAHLDIKCENLLIGENFKLKITDFDLSQYLTDGKLESRGTLYYRAPEVIDGTCRDFTKADIYSAGIILFVMRSGGVPPHLEQDEYQGINLHRMMYEDKKNFWEVQESYVGRSKFYSESFKKLFYMMVDKDPNKRATIDKIKKSEWYNQPILSNDQLKTEMKYFFL